MMECSTSLDDWFTSWEVRMIEHMGGRQFRVGKHYVDLDGDPICYCLDSQYRGHRKGYMCKHERAARDYERSQHENTSDV